MVISRRLLLFRASKKGCRGIVSSYMIWHIYTQNPRKEMALSKTSLTFLGEKYGAWPRRNRVINGMEP